MMEDNLMKKTLATFTSNLPLNKIIDRSVHIPKSATLSQKYIGIFFIFIL